MRMRMRTSTPRCAICQHILADINAACPICLPNGLADPVYKPWPTEQECLESAAALRARVAELEGKVQRQRDDINARIRHWEQERKCHVHYKARAEQAKSENEGLYKLVDHYRAVAKAAEEAHKHWPFLVAQPPAGFWCDMEKLWAAVQAHRETRDE